MDLRIVGFILASFVACACAHSFKTGACPPEVDTEKNFDPDKFTGIWYVIQKTSTSSSCMKLNISKVSENYYKVREYSRTYPLQAVGVDHTTIHDGKLTFTDQTEKAKMNLRFSYSPLGTTNFWVVATDYDTFAATWTCEKVLFGHIQDGTILSRTPRLDKQIAAKLRNRFESFGIDSNSFSFIDQKPCMGMLQSKSDHDGVISLGPFHINRKLNGPEP